MLFRVSSSGLRCRVRRARHGAAEDHAERRHGGAGHRPARSAFRRLHHRPRPRRAGCSTAWCGSRPAASIPAKLEPDLAEKWESHRGRQDLDLPPAPRRAVPRRLRRAHRRRRRVQPEEGGRCQDLGVRLRTAAVPDHRGGRSLHRPSGAEGQRPERARHPDQLCAGLHRVEEGGGAARRRLQAQPDRHRAVRVRRASRRTSRSSWSPTTPISAARRRSRRSATASFRPTPRAISRSRTASST